MGKQIQFTQCLCLLYCSGFAKRVRVSASACLTDVSVPSCLSLVQVLQCDNSSTSPPPPLLPPGLTKSTNSTRHRRKSLFPLQESALWNSFNKNTQCRLLGAHSMGSLNLFATADSSTLQYGVNIKMTNRGGGSLMVRELSCRPEGHMLLMAPEWENLASGK